MLISRGNSLFGWASAPFDPEWEWKFPKKSALMAMAGPAANFTLMFLAVLGVQVGRHFGVFRDHSWSPFAEQVVWTMFSLNLLLGLFNLVPAPPHRLRSERGHRMARRQRERSQGESVMPTWCEDSGFPALFRDNLDACATIIAVCSGRDNVSGSSCERSCCRNFSENILTSEASVLGKRDGGPHHFGTAA